MSVVWTKEARNSFNDIVDYLIESWTTKEAGLFIDMIEDTIDKIITHPELFKVSQYDKQSREAFITKHTTMFYRVKDDLIEIEYFWGNFQNPKKIKTLFKK